MGAKQYMATNMGQIVTPGRFAALTARWLHLRAETGDQIAPGPLVLLNFK